ncbi:hypothetical protein [Paucilactobacillus hokkaidonensis]|nr:hypothetical protein [Paucilactobacillus hokkaidonensis]
MFALIGLLLVMIVVFAIKQRDPVNTDDPDTSISTTSSSSHKKKT